MSFRLLCTLMMFAMAAPLLAQQEPTSRPSSRPTYKGRKMGHAKPIVFNDQYEVYGARLAGLPVVSMKKISATPAAWNGKSVQLRGKVTKVCQNKGCWMNLEDGERTVFVKFTGYKFFVPLDAAGKPVACEGKVTVEVVSEAERRHLAEDEGKSAAEIAKIKGDKVEVRFMADAVRMGKLPPVKKKTRKKGTKIQ